MKRGWNVSETVGITGIEIQAKGFEWVEISWTVGLNETQVGFE